MSHSRPRTVRYVLAERQWSWIRAVLVPILILAWFAVLFVVGMALGRVFREVIVLVLAAVIAYAITPLVGLLVRYLPFLRRGGAIAIVGVLGFVVFAVLKDLVTYYEPAQIAQLVERLPGYLDKAQLLEPKALAVLQPFGITNQALDQVRSSLIDQVRSAGAGIAGGTLGTVTTVAGGVVDAFVVLVLSIYLTANGPRIARGLRNAGAGVGWGRRVSGFITTFNNILGGYVRGMLLLALLVSVLVTGLMAAIGVPYAILLGVVAFFMEFIPVFGVFISGAICVLLTLGTVGLVKAGIALVGFVAIHFIEGELIGPRIMGKAVGIHPAVSLMALIVFTDLFGVWGALFGAPAAGLIQAAIFAGWREFRRSDLVDHTPTEGSPPDSPDLPPGDRAPTAAGEAASRRRRRFWLARPGSRAPDRSRAA